MRLLLLAYYFPPDGGPGAQRPIAFARHLGEHGVECTVLTRSPPAVRNRYEPADAAALAAVEARAKIVRAAPANTLAEVCAGMLVAGDAAIAAERPDCVLATMSPFPLWRVAHTLAVRHDLPVVYDLRDPWALDGVVDYRTWWHWRRELAEMRAMLRSADGVVANTPECATLFTRLEPTLAEDRVVAITNGWDADDFPPAPASQRVGEHLHLVYGGSFLCGELYRHERPARRLLGRLRYRPEPIVCSGRTPLHLLRAIRLLREDGDPAGQAIRFTAIGQIDSALQRCVAESGVAGAVELVGYRPHAELAASLRQADALFLTLHGLPRGHRSRIVPGKAYEYLASGRPILAALPEGDARDLVSRSPVAFVADATDDRALANQLAALYGAWRSGAFATARPMPGIAAYERRALAGALAEFVGRIVAAS